MAFPFSVYNIAYPAAGHKENEPDFRELIKRIVGQQNKEALPTLPGRCEDRESEPRTRFYICDNFVTNSGRKTEKDDYDKSTLSGKST